jgi:hypothetical protein
MNEKNHTLILFACLSSGGMHCQVSTSNSGLNHLPNRKHLENDEK